MGRASAREPNVPPAVARLGALLSKAELIELLWSASCNVETMINVRPSSTYQRLVGLIAAINRKRRRQDPLRGPIDASRLNGAGVAELREASAEALRWDRNGERAKP